MEEETPIQRATRILEESIAFRTSLVSEIHKEIHEAVWTGWGANHPRSDMCYSRTSERTLKVQDRVYAEIGRGKRHYIGRIK